MFSLLLFYPHNTFVRFGCYVRKMKQKRNFTEKPYNRCLFCPKRLSEPRECNGPRTGSMTTDRWREYMRDIKEVDGLTFEEIAARTGGQMSAASIQNALAPGATRDLTRETARIIENAVFGVSVAHPCPFELMEDLSADAKRTLDLENDLRSALADITRICDLHEKELQAVREEAQKKMDYLIKENLRLQGWIDQLLRK